MMVISMAAQNAARAKDNATDLSKHIILLIYNTSTLLRYYFLSCFIFPSLCFNLSLNESNKYS